MWRTRRGAVAGDGHVVAMLTVVTAPPAMVTARELRLVPVTDHVVQPDATAARTVCVAQRTTAVSVYYSTCNKS